MEPDKHEKVEWHSIGKLPENMMPFVAQAMGMILNNKYYSEWGFNED